MLSTKRLSLGLAFISTLAVFGCNGGDETHTSWLYDPGASLDSAYLDCREDFQEIVAPSQINGGHHVHFDPSDIELLSDPSLRVQSAHLNVTLQGKLKGTAFELPLSVNGLQASGRDGTPFYSLLSQNEANDTSTVRHELHKMSINGADPVLNFMFHIFKNKGLIRFSFLGTYKVLKAELVINGYSIAGCTDPEPEPTPTPTLPVTAPKTVITSVEPSASITASSAISFQFESDQLGVSFECSLDGAPFVACASPHAYSGLTDGAHLFEVFAMNAAGIRDPQGASHAWSVNSLLPGATLHNTSELPGVTSSTTIEFEFSHEGAAGYLCSLDGGAFEPCSSPMVYAGLGEGLHEFSVTSVDENGNPASNPVEFQWVIDFTAPLVSIIQAVPSSSFTQSTSIEFAFMANEPASFECALFGSQETGAFTPCTSPHLYLGLEEGEHRFEVRARDAAGNLSSPASYGWSVDRTPPVLSLVSSSPLPGATNSHQILVEFEANEIAAFSCSLDGGAFESCNSPYFAPIFEQGNHALSIIATDSAGNTSTPLNLDWLMDFSSPEISFQEISPAGSHINTSWLTASVYSSEQVILSARLNNEELGQVLSPVTLSGLVQGAYELFVSAFDLVGNASNTISHSFIVDQTPPSVSLSGQYSDGALTNSTSNRFTFEANEQATFECQLNSAGYTPCSSPFEITGLAQGNHLVEVRAKDLAGNQGEAASLAWSVDLTAPVVSLSVASSTKTSIQFSFSANESGAVFQCSLNGASFSSCSSPVSFSNLGDGNYSFSVRARDLAGNTGAPASHAWVVDSTPPVITLTPSRDSNTAIQFSFSANKAGVAFQCSLDGAAFAACSSPASYNNLSLGEHSFAVKGTDSSGNTSTPVSHAWTVDPAVTTTLTNVTPSAGLTKETSISFSFSTNVGVSFLCKLNGGALLPCTSPMTYSGLPDGTRVFRVYAVDKWGTQDSVGASHEWTVDTTPPLVTLSAHRPSSSSIQFTFTSNESGVIFQCSLDGGSFSICASPRSYNGLWEGPHTFAVRARDAANNTGPAATYSWTIEPVNTTITSVTPAESPTSSSTASFSFSSNIGTSFRCSLNGSALAPCSSPMTYAGLASGNHQFKVHAVDPWGAQDPIGATHTWTVDKNPPVVTWYGVTMTSTSFTINWTTSEPATSALYWGMGNDASIYLAADGIYRTSHSIRISGLAPGTLYSYVITGADPLGNVYTDIKRSVRTNY